MDVMGKRGGQVEDEMGDGGWVDVVVTAMSLPAPKRALAVKAQSPAPFWKEEDCVCRRGGSMR